jgi:hypothetical protein
MNTTLSQQHGSVMLSGRPPVPQSAGPTQILLLSPQGPSGFVCPSGQALTQSVFYTPPLRS